MNVVAVLQARTGSRRFPNKVLAPLLGAPMLQRQLDRIHLARSLDAVVVATSVGAEDDGIEALARTCGVECVRGSLHDVLDRVTRAARAANADHVVRLTGDCPLADPAVIDVVVDHHLEGGFDYTSNLSGNTFPDGYDVEVAAMAALEDAWCAATLPTEREHVTPYLYGHPERFRIGEVRADRDLGCLRLTVDHPDDLRLVEAVFAALHAADPAFGLEEITRLFHERPDLLAVNGAHNPRLPREHSA